MADPHDRPAQLPTVLGADIAPSVRCALFLIAAVLFALAFTLAFA